MLGEERASSKIDSSHGFAESVLAVGGEPTWERKLIYHSQFLLLRATSLLLCPPNSIVFVVQRSFFAVWFVCFFIAIAFHILSVFVLNLRNVFVRTQCFIKKCRYNDHVLQVLEWDFWMRERKCLMAATESRAAKVRKEVECDSYS